MSEVVIGEAVVLDLRPARLPSRALALAIDVLIMAVLGVLLVAGTALLGADFDDALAAAVIIVVLVGLVVGYPLLWETLTRGRSPGKYALGLRVVRDDGGPIRFRHALTRALAGLILDFGVLAGGTGIVAVVFSLSSARGQRLGDLLAGTIVLRERVPRSGAADLPPVDPGLAAWAMGLELSRVPDDLALTARQFLARAPQLATYVRTSMAERLAADLSSRVAPPPPPGIPPEAYVAAVLGERRRRETERLARSRPDHRVFAPAGLPGQPSPAAPPAAPPGAPPGAPPVAGPWSVPAGSPSGWAPPGTVPAQQAPGPSGFAPPG